MTAFDQIGAARAAAKLAVARALGATIQLSHRGAANVTLYARILKQSIERLEEGAGVVSEVRVLEIEIPTQTGFTKPTTDVEPITPFDQITYQSRKFFVADPVQKDAQGNVYTIKALERKRLASGA